MKRQGDLLILKVKDIPPAAKQTEDLILAEGEATGHRHELTDGIVFEEDPYIYFDVAKDMEVTLTHPEHDALTFTPGKYKVVRQREYEPGGWRHVAD